MIRCLMHMIQLENTQDFTTISGDSFAFGAHREIRWCVVPPDSNQLNECSHTQSEAGTMFELVQALNDGAEVLKKRVPNPISLNAGCELFIAFVTLFPHESDVSALSAIVFPRAFMTFRFMTIGRVSHSSRPSSLSMARNMLRKPSRLEIRSLNALSGSSGTTRWYENSHSKTNNSIADYRD